MAEQHSVQSDEELARRTQEIEWQRVVQHQLQQQGPVPTYAGYDGNNNGLRHVDYAGLVNSDINNNYGTLRANMPDIYMGAQERKFVATYSLGRGIKILAMLDGFLLILFSSFTAPFLIFFLWGPACGWISGEQYSKSMAMTYFAYFIARIITDATLIAYLSWGFIFPLLIDLWIARYVLMFLKLLSSCTEDELSGMRLLSNSNQQQAAVWSAGSTPYFSTL